MHEKVGVALPVGEGLAREIQDGLQMIDPGGLSSWDYVCCGSCSLRKRNSPEMVAKSPLLHESRCRNRRLSAPGLSFSDKNGPAFS